MRRFPPESNATKASSRPSGETARNVASTQYAKAPPGGGGTVNRSVAGGARGRRPPENGARAERPRAGRQRPRSPRGATSRRDRESHVAGSIGCDRLQLQRPVPRGLPAVLRILRET